jgi:hypothetical protein
MVTSCGTPSMAIAIVLSSPAAVPSGARRSIATR